MLQAKRAVMIGGGYPQLALIEKLAEFDVELIVIDSRSGIPSARLADHVVPLDRYDLSACKEYIEKKMPDFVVSGGSDKAVYHMSLLSETLGLTPYVPSTVSRLPLNKDECSRLFIEHGVDVPRSYSCTSVEEVELIVDTLRYPVVVKPDEGIGQKAVDKATSESQLFGSAQRAFEETANSKILIQEFVEGDEIGVNGIVLEGTFHLLTTAYRRSARQRGGAFGVAVEKVFPWAMTEVKQRQVSELLQKASTAMGIENAPIYCQLIAADDRLVILEMMPRLGGGEDPRLVHLATGFNIVRAVSLLAAGEKFTFDTLLDREPSSAVVLRFLTAQSGCIQSVKGISKACEVPGVEDVIMYYEVGDTVHSLRSSHDRLGYVLAASSTVDDASKRVSEAEQLITVEVR